MTSASPSPEVADAADINEIAGLISARDWAIDERRRALRLADEYADTQSRQTFLDIAEAMAGLADRADDAIKAAIRQ